MPRKDLPSPNAPNFAPRVREELHAMMGRVGDGADRALTLREMIASGLLTQAPGGGLQPGPATEYEADLTPPPPPSNLQATTSGNSILVTINPQTYRQGNGPGTVTVYGAKYMLGDALPVFADAAVLDEFPGDVHAFPVDPGALYRIWAKSVSRDGVPSEPAGGTNGVEPVPGLLDDVSIASLTASRIRSGSITVGQFIQAAGYVPATAGWRINGDGTAEFSQVVVRGTIFASQGAIGGWNIGSNYLQSTTYVLGESGTRFNSDGTGQIGGLTVLADKVRNTAYSDFFEGFELSGNGVIRAYSNSGQNVLNTGATGTGFFLRAGSAFTLRANGDFSTTGRVQSPDGRTYFDPKASGSDPVFLVRNSAFAEKVRIEADGRAVFNDVVFSRPNIVASGTWSRPGGIGTWDFSQISDESGTRWQQNTLSVFVPTGYSVIEDVLVQGGPAFVAKAVVTATFMSPAQPDDVLVFRPMVSPVVVFQNDHYVTGSVGSPGGTIVLRLDFVLPADIRSGIAAIRYTSINWSLARLT